MIFLNSRQRKRSRCTVNIFPLQAGARIKYFQAFRKVRRIKSSGKEAVSCNLQTGVFAKQILEHFDLASYFEFVGGADLEETRVGKGDVIQYVLDTCGLSDKKEKILMIGDREHDVLGARKQGLEW